MRISRRRFLKLAAATAVAPIAAKLPVLQNHPVVGQIGTIMGMDFVTPSEVGGMTGTSSLLPEGTFIPEEFRMKLQTSYYPADFFQTPPEFFETPDAEKDT